MTYCDYIVLEFEEYQELKENMAYGLCKCKKGNIADKLAELFCFGDDINREKISLFDGETKKTVIEYLATGEDYEIGDLAKKLGAEVVNYEYGPHDISDTVYYFPDHSAVIVMDHMWDIASLRRKLWI